LPPIFLVPSRYENVPIHYDAFPHLRTDVQSLRYPFSEQLISAYSLSFAIFTQLLIVLTSRVNWKPLFVGSLAVGNALSVQTAHHKRNAVPAP